MLERNGHLPKKKEKNQEAGALAATLHPFEAPAAYTEGRSDMPELLTSDGEDDWDPHGAGLAYFAEVDDTASLCPVAQTIAGPEVKYQEQDPLQARTQAFSHSLRVKEDARKPPFPCLMAGLHAALEASSSSTDDVSQSEYHSTTELPPDTAELCSAVIDDSGMTFDPGLQKSNDLRCVERLQEFDTEIKHRPGYKHENADAMSRPPPATILEPPAMIAFSQAEQRAASDAGAGSVRTGYGAVAEAKEEEEPNSWPTQDLDPPVSPSLACEACHQPDQDGLRLICTLCDNGSHTFCLDPPLADLPVAAEDPWYCELCPNLIDSLDITEDIYTFNFSQGDPLDASAPEKPRMRSRAQGYYFEAGTMEPTAEALVNNMQPLQDALAIAHENSRLARNKHKRLRARRQLHGDPIDKGRAPMTIGMTAPAAAPVTPGSNTAPVSYLPVVLIPLDGAKTSTTTTAATTAAEKTAQPTVPASMLATKGAHQKLTRSELETLF